jgi:hypothetical protein
MTVPHVGHFPLIAFRPFFIVSSIPSMISFLALHLTQYPSGITNSLQRRGMHLSSYTNSLFGGCHYRQPGKGYRGGHSTTGLMPERVLSL